jgi:hypothetical protein
MFIYVASIYSIVEIITFLVDNMEAITLSYFWSSMSCVSKAFITYLGILAFFVLVFFIKDRIINRKEKIQKYGKTSKNKI